MFVRDIHVMLYEAGDLFSKMTNYAKKAAENSLTKKITN